VLSPNILMRRSTCSVPFIFERLEVCFLHGVFVTLPFVALARGWAFWLGGLAGMPCISC